MAEISGNTLIYNAPLSRRAINLLINNSHLFGVTWIPGTPSTLTFSNLSGASKKDLSALRGAGPKTVREIEELCRKAGVALDP